MSMIFGRPPYEWLLAQMDPDDLNKMGRVCRKVARNLDNTKGEPHT